MCGLPFDLAILWSDRLPTALHQIIFWHRWWHGRWWSCLHLDQQRLVLWRLVTSSSKKDLDHCSPQPASMMICCESLCSDRFLLASFKTKLYTSTKCFLATDVPQMWCAIGYLHMQCAADAMRGYVAVWSQSSLDLTDWTTAQEQSCGLPFDLAVGWSDRLPTALHHVWNESDWTCRLSTLIIGVDPFLEMQLVCLFPL